MGIVRGALSGSALSRSLDIHDEINASSNAYMAKQKAYDFIDHRVLTGRWSKSR
jgi:hypothetical protein